MNLETWWSSKNDFELWQELALWAQEYWVKHLIEFWHADCKLSLEWMESEHDWWPNAWLWLFWRSRRKLATPGQSTVRRLSLRRVPWLVRQQYGCLRNMRGWTCEILGNHSGLLGCDTLPLAYYVKNVSDKLNGLGVKQFVGGGSM